jgi:membrane protease YdiL (CAAX protease family)
MGIGIVIPFLLLAILSSAGFVERALETGMHRPNLWQILRTILLPMLIVCSEEIAFRGYFFQRLSMRYGVIVGAIGSAALWGIMHIPGMASDGGPSYSIAMGTLTFISWGVALSCVFEIYGASLWAPIGIHYGYNLGFSIVGLAVGIDAIGPAVMIGHGRWIPETGLVGFVCWTAIALLGIRQINRISSAG